MIDMGDYRMPTVEEVLGGETQAGVPRPIGVFEPRAPSLPAVERPPAHAMTRWAAVKALLGIIFRGDHQ